MIVEIVSYPKSTKWKSCMGSICAVSINHVPGSKNLVNPSGIEARRNILRFCPTPVFYAPKSISDRSSDL